MKLQRTVVSAAVLVLSATAASAQIQLKLLHVVDVSATANSASTSFIGNNPTSVAWDGTNAFLGGYNNSGATGNTGIVEVSNVLTTPTIGTAFGTLSTPNGRSVTGLTVSADGKSLYASYDNGTGSGSAVRSFNTANGNLNWSIGAATADNGRRGNGVAIDPGFNGSTPSVGNVAFLNLGSGRRNVVDATTGTYIYAPSGQTGSSGNGAIILPANSNTFWRSLAFDTNGDLYARESNRIVKGKRTGDNSFMNGATSIFAALTQTGSPSFQDNQNLAVVNSSDFGGYVVANDNPGGSAQSFLNTIKAYSTADASQKTITFDFGAFAAPADGVGAYNFAYSASNQTLAISDFANRQLYIFQTGNLSAAPEANSLILLAIGGVGLGAVLIARRRKKSVQA